MTHLVLSLGIPRKSERGVQIHSDVVCLLEIWRHSEHLNNQPIQGEKFSAIKFGSQVLDLISKGGQMKLVFLALCFLQNVFKFHFDVLRHLL